MPSNPTDRYFFSRKLFLLFLIMLAVSLSGGCAFLSSRKPQALFSKDEVEAFVKDIKEQEAIASTFGFTGKISINGWVWDATFNILVFGRKDPFMFKLEISHSMGKPLLYFLVKEDKMVIRDFSEKKQYVGEFSSANLSRFLPNLDCSPEMIWSFLRGYPSLPSHGRVYEGVPGVLYAEDLDKRIIARIAFSKTEGIKEAVSSPPRGIDMKFTNFRKTGDFYYAEETEVEDIKGKKDMTIKRKNISFNKDIPDELFTLKNRPVYDVVNLDEIQ